MIIITETKQSKPNHSSKIKKVSITGIIIIIIAGILSFFVYQHSQSYDDLPQINDPEKLLNHVQKHQNDDKLNFEYYYRPGCKDCQHMQKIGIVDHLKVTKRNYPLAVINIDKFLNANDPEANTWLHSNYVTNTPTLIVRDHGYAIYTYSGTNLKIFKLLLNGINPTTNQPFKQSKHPASNVYQNDFKNANAILETFRPKTLANINN